MKVEVSWTHWSKSKCFLVAINEVDAQLFLIVTFSDVWIVDFPVGAVAICSESCQNVDGLLRFSTQQRKAFLGISQLQKQVSPLVVDVDPPRHFLFAAHDFEHLILVFKACFVDVLGLLIVGFNSVLPICHLFDSE